MSEDEIKDKIGDIRMRLYLILFSEFTDILLKEKDIETLGKLDYGDIIYTKDGKEAEDLLRKGVYDNALGYPNKGIYIMLTDKFYDAFHKYIKNISGNEVVRILYKNARLLIDNRKPDFNTLSKDHKLILTGVHEIQGLMKKNENLMKILEDKMNLAFPHFPPLEKNLLYAINELRKFGPKEKEMFASGQYNVKSVHKALKNLWKNGYLRRTVKGKIYNKEIVEYSLSDKGKKIVEWLINTEEC